MLPASVNGRQIARTLDSVLAQTITDYEVIIVDDGSRDNGSEIVKEYANRESRIHYKYKENGGVSSARNLGIHEASGEWLLFLDGDDEFTPDALETFNKMLSEYKGCKLFTCGQHNDRWTNNHKCNCQRNKLSESPYMSLWLNRFWPCPGNTMIHKSLPVKYGYFDERMSFFEDLDFFLRMMQAGEIAYTSKVVLKYHQQEGGLSLSKHLAQKEMAYYIPQMKLKGFFHRAIRYENLEFVIAGWQDNREVRDYYIKIRDKEFSRIHSALHWLRQQLVRHHWI